MLQEKGFKIRFKPIGGATWILWVDDLKIACDPILLPKGTVHDFKWFKSKRLEEAVYFDVDFKGIDLWLLTHNHEDHLDELGLQKIENQVDLVIHPNLAQRLEGYKVNILKHKQVVQLNKKGLEIEVEAIPAVHGVVRVVAKLAGGVNGYWLKIKKGEKLLQIYISADTVFKQKIASYLSGRRADIYIPNVGGACKGTVIGTLTLTAKMLRKYLSVIHPQLTLPVHFGTFSHYNESIHKVEKLGHPSIKILKAGEEFIVE